MFYKFIYFTGVVIILINTLLTFLFGMSITNTIGYICGIAFIIFGKYFKRFSKSLKFFVSLCIVAGLLLVSYLLFLIVKGSHDTTNFNEDVVIVLGSGIRGEKLTPMLKSRLDTTIEYLEKNSNVIIIVSGGQGYGEDIPEAVAMKRYLVDKGIDSDKIIEEKEARNTYENIKNSKIILNNLSHLDVKSIVLVTTDFHMYRALSTAKQYGVDVKTYSAPLDWYLRPGSTMREFISILKFWFLSLRGANV